MISLAGLICSANDVGSSLQAADADVPSALTSAIAAVKLRTPRPTVLPVLR